MSEERVQPIIVSKGGSHAATVKCAAVASVLAWLHHSPSDPEPWTEWLGGRFTKSVRRAPEAQLHRLAEEHDGVTVHLGRSVASAFTPLPYSEYPSSIKRLQVSGTDLERVATHDRDDTRPEVRVLVRDDLTTGKAAAQAAHALMAWAISADHAVLARWHTHPLVTTVRFVRPYTLTAAAEMDGVYPIVDAGLTEIDPGTLTAVAIPARLDS